MQAFHNDATIKSAIMAGLAVHRAADELVQGSYWENGKGCAVGCTLETIRAMKGAKTIDHFSHNVARDACRPRRRLTNVKRKITAEQRHELVEIYRHMGLEISQQMCLEYGVSAEYARRESNAMYGSAAPHRRQWRKTK